MKVVGQHKRGRGWVSSGAELGAGVGPALGAGGGTSIIGAGGGISIRGRGWDQH